MSQLEVTRESDTVQLPICDEDVPCGDTVGPGINFGQACWFDGCLLSVYSICKLLTIDLKINLFTNLQPRTQVYPKKCYESRLAG